MFLNDVVLLNIIHIFESLNKHTEITMGKHTPDSLKGAKSPFLESLVIPMYNRTKIEDLVQLSNIKVTDNIIKSIGNVEQNKKSYSVEKDRNIHLYYDNDGNDLRQHYIDLSKEGRMMLDYVMFYCLRENKLLFYLDNKDFMKKYSVKSHTTVWSSKKDLINSSFIAPTSCQNWYWVNPKFVFRGFRSRVHEMKDNLKFTNETLKKNE